MPGPLLLPSSDKLGAVQVWHRFPFIMGEGAWDQVIYAAFHIPDATESVGEECPEGWIFVWALRKEGTMALFRKLALSFFERHQVVKAIFVTRGEVLQILLEDLP